MKTREVIFFLGCMLIVAAAAVIPVVVLRAPSIVQSQSAAQADGLPDATSTAYTADVSTVQTSTSRPPHVPDPGQSPSQASSHPPVTISLPSVTEIPSPMQPLSSRASSLLTTSAPSARSSSQTPSISPDPPVEDRPDLRQRVLKEELTGVDQQQNWYCGVYTDLQNAPVAPRSLTSSDKDTFEQTLQKSTWTAEPIRSDLYDCRLTFHDPGLSVFVKSDGHLLVRYINTVHDYSSAYFSIDPADAQRITARAAKLMNRR